MIDMTLDMDILYLQTGVIVLLSVLYVVISLVAVLGNSTVIFIVCTSRRMQVSPGGDYQLDNLLYLHYFYQSDNLLYIILCFFLLIFTCFIQCFQLNGHSRLVDLLLTSTF